MCGFLLQHKFPENQQAESPPLLHQPNVGLLLQLLVSKFDNLKLDYGLILKQLVFLQFRGTKKGHGAWSVSFPPVSPETTHNMQSVATVLQTLFTHQPS